MKILNKLFAIVILFSVSSVIASDDVYLDLNPSEISNYNTGSLNFNNTKSDFDEDDISPTLPNIKKMFDEDLYSKKTLTSKREKKMGKSTVGVKSDTTLAPESITQTRTLYTKHELTEKMNVRTSYKTKSGVGEQMKGTVSVAPEYKINKKTSVKNIYSRDIGNQNNKTELNMNYKPFNDDRMDFNAGVGQVQRDNGGQSSSQINFGTNFRF